MAFHLCELPSIFGLGCWLLWQWRNKVIFDSTAHILEDPSMVVRQTAESFRNSWELVSKLSKKPIRRWEEISWNPPPFNCQKLNTNGSVHGTLALVGASGLIRESDGKWIKGFQQNLSCSTVIVAEFWVILSRLELAWNVGCRNLMVESDSESACILVRNRTNSTAIIKPIWTKISQLLSRDWMVSIHHIYREANFCVDWLANRTCNQPLGLHICEEAPRGLLHLFMPYLLLVVLG